jgi:multidrug efflux pump subunit AcrB
MSANTAAAPAELPQNAYSPLPPGTSYKPAVSAAATIPELTPRSVGWGLFLCVVFTIASAYSGLKVGQVMEAAIPISILTSFNFFYAFGITLNSLTLVGMALAIGMLLDNSVVVLENIYRLAGKGVPPLQEVTQGTTEVWRSIVASTLTTIMVFLPFLFSDNFLVVMLGYNVGVSIISTLLVSLAVAILLVPMASYGMMKRQIAKNIFYEKVTTNLRMVQIYLVFLKTCMRNPAGTIISLGVFSFGK